MTGTEAEARPAEPTRSQSLDALRRSAPEAMAGKILAERDRMQGERKLVTALFADIVGSTSLAEGMDPEDWREIVGGAHQRVSQAIYRYEGTIAQLLGDGVLAFFGAPLAHEDDPERAIRAGLNLLDGIASYAKELKQAGRVEDFQVRVGLNTGLVVVGDIGTDLHMEYLAVGDTVNLAARVQSAAEPGELLVTQSTYKLAMGLFEFEDQGEIEVKGKAEPIHVFRAVKESHGAVRRRGISGLDSPLVGRSREFATLNQTIEEVGRGNGSIVSLVAEAGLGKSRLIAEWRRAVINSGAIQADHWFEGRCVSYGASMAHHLSTDLIRSLIDAPPGTSMDATRTALRTRLEALLGDELSDVYPFIAHLLGLELEDDMAARVKYLEGQALQAKYVTAFQEMLRRMATDQPTVMICEDIHWADPSSVELGLQVMPIVPEIPLVVVLVSRPDKESPGWRMVELAREVAGAGALELHLAPLTEQDSRQLVSNLLNVEALPDDVRAMILSKAEGNPFFVEEVIRMLIDQGQITSEDGGWTVAGDLESLDIPDTLQGVLMARIDRLPDDAKRTLQVAAVIGRQFRASILEEVLKEIDQQ
ncbi:MAG: adenylate/guanylate cyclase domain-containing protein [Anaerolineales bacterium]